MKKDSVNLERARALWGPDVRSLAAALIDAPREFGRRLWSCRLCRSVTYSVFLLILAIESVILIPSALNFRSNAVRMLEQQAAAIMQPLAGSDVLLENPHELERALRRASAGTQMLAASLRRGNGAVLAQIGNVDFSDFAIDDVIQGRRDRVSRFSLGGTRYDLAWRARIGGDWMVFVARMDSARVNADLLAFVLRVAAMVALIVAVVTIGTMLVIYRSVLSSILRLRRSMLGATANPDQADDYRLRDRPRDELGDVFQAYDEMLTRVAESKRDDQGR